MPKTLLPVADLDQSVTRPIVIDVVRQVQRYTGIGDDTVIFFPGPDGQSYQPLSIIRPDQNYQGTGEFDGAQRLGNFNQVTVEITEEYDLDRTLAQAVLQPEHLLIFADKKIGVFMKPAYSNTDVSLTFKYRTKDQTTAEKWQNDMRQRVSGNRDVHLLELTYSYAIIPAHMAILKEIYRLRELVAGYGDTFETWFLGHATPKMTQITDSAGKNLQYVIPQTQIGVPANFDFDGFPDKGGRDEPGATWTASFTLKFKYDRPTEQVMTYPLVVHNQLLDQKYRPAAPPYTLESRPKEYSLTAKALAAFQRTDANNATIKRMGARIPVFDEFLPTSLMPGTQTLVTVLLGLDSVNPTHLFSLQQLGDYTFDPDILIFLLEEYPYLNKAYQSVFCLSLYQGQDRMTDGLIAIDADLNVTSTIALDFRQVYHARISLYRNLCGLNPAAQKRLQRHCGAAQKIIAALAPQIPAAGKLPVCALDNFMSSADLGAVCRIINAGTFNPNTVPGGQLTIMKTVGTTTITARK